ncbi:MAG TPA: hypothetical protein H9841_06665 [Candidatus Flavonifractor merdigallinarum]|uniref:Uncharacterized protein n=1 Tax=Candidatus Flavonifractor merdigallinarum TaxID=2838589 RepID=A0A9D1Y8L0_9FIRM|nr:hypothetical protein [Candidatus Flavonifractor merdigallinarum]
MFGLSPIGVGRSETYSNTIQNRLSPSSMSAVGRVEPAQTTPVPPVTGVSAVQRDSTQLTPPNEPQLPTIREGADPVEMAVRGRIQYLNPEDAGQQNTLNPADAQNAQSVQKSKSAQEVMEEGECQTCKERKYQDGSNDPGVSYQTPTNIAPELAASAVRGHEQEHVVREQAKAKREDREVVNQSVTLHTNICPECGKVYVSGGTTRTTTRAADVASLYQQEEPQPSLFQGVA